MGFFYEQSAADAAAARKRSHAPKSIPIELMRKQGCLACSRNAADVRKEQPEGANAPVVYVLLGEPKPGEITQAPKDNYGTDLLIAELRKHDLLRHSRFGYSVRCSGDKAASIQEATCCSKYLHEDILASRPVVIIGSGQRPLAWARPDAEKGALDNAWRGKLWPVQVDGVAFWYYQIQDLTYTAFRKDNAKYDCAEHLALKFDIAKLASLLQRDDFEEPVVITREQASAGCRYITGEGELDYEDLCFFLDGAEKEEEVGIDFETTRLRPYPTLDKSGTPPMILTCSVSTTTSTLAFPVHHPLGWKGSLSHQVAVTRRLIEFIANSNVKVAHNLVFELEWTGHELAEELLRGTQWGDSMAAMHSLDERRGSLSLGDTTLQLFGFDVKALSNLDTARLIEYPLEDVLKYNSLDSKWCLLSWIEARHRMRHEPVLWEETLRKVRRSPVVVLSQLQGVLIDVEYAKQMQAVLEDEIDSAVRIIKQAREVKKFEEQFNRPFSPTSDDDVLALVKDVMRRPECQTGDNKFSCDESVLAAIPKEAGVAPQQILIHRGSSKLRGTYILPVTTPLAKDVRGVLYADGRAHTNYNLMIAVSGRLSSDDPNLQNYPKRKRKEVRGIIVAPPGHSLLACDYGQIEARVIAMASEDRVLVDALWTDFDIHGHWATRFLEDYPEIADWIIETFEVPGDDKKKIHKVLRQEAKNKWVFPQFFGASPFSCARNLHMPDDVAKKFASEFWDQFKGVKRWQQKVVAKYEKDFYAETLTGRRRRGPMTPNELFNHSPQGTAADIVLDAMDRCSAVAADNDWYWYQPPINVHDDLTFCVPDEHLETSLERITYEMCNANYSFINVPILVEASYSKRRWHELQEVGVYRSDTLGIHSRT